jgi:hypothetical protein
MFRFVRPLCAERGNAESKLSLPAPHPLHSPKLGRMLFSIASANEGYCGVQPRVRSFALLTCLLLRPRFALSGTLPARGAGRFSFCVSQS